MEEDADLAEEMAAAKALAEWNQQQLDLQWGGLRFVYGFNVTRNSDLSRLKENNETTST